MDQFTLGRLPRPGEEDEDFSAGIGGPHQEAFFGGAIPEDEDYVGGFGAFEEDADALNDDTFGNAALPPGAAPGFLEEFIQPDLHQRRRPSAAASSSAAALDAEDDIAFGGDLDVTAGQDFFFSDGASHNMIGMGSLPPLQQSHDFFSAPAAPAGAFLNPLLLKQQGSAASSAAAAFGFQNMLMPQQPQQQQQQASATPSLLQQLFASAAASAGSSSLPSDASQIEQQLKSVGISQQQPAPRAQQQKAAAPSAASDGALLLRPTQVISRGGHVAAPAISSSTLRPLPRRPFPAPLPRQSSSASASPEAPSVPIPHSSLVLQYKSASSPAGQSPSSPSPAGNNRGRFQSDRVPTLAHGGFHIASAMMNYDEVDFVISAQTPFLHSNNPFWDDYYSVMMEAKKQGRISLPPNFSFSALNSGPVSTQGKRKDPFDGERVIGRPPAFKARGPRATLDLRSAEEIETALKERQAEKEKEAAAAAVAEAEAAKKSKEPEKKEAKDNKKQPSPSAPAAAAAAAAAAEPAKEKVTRISRVTEADKYSPSSTLAASYVIEDCFSLLLEVQDIDMALPHSSNAQVDELKEKRQNICLSILNMLGLMERITSKQGLVGNADITSNHMLVRVVSLPKGAKFIARLLLALQDQTLLVLTNACFVFFNEFFSPATHAEDVSLVQNLARSLRAAVFRLNLPSLVFCLTTYVAFNAGAPEASLILSQMNGGSIIEALLMCGLQQLRSNAAAAATMAPHFMQWSTQTDMLFRSLAGRLGSIILVSSANGQQTASDFGWRFVTALALNLRKEAWPFVAAELSAALNHQMTPQLQAFMNALQAAATVAQASPAAAPPMPQGPPQMMPPHMMPHQIMPPHMAHPHHIPPPPPPHMFMQGPPPGHQFPPQQPHPHRM